MSTVKILLGEIAAAWKHTLKELVAENGELQVVGEVEKPVDILLQAKSVSPDVVVLSQDPQGAEPGICSHLLLEYPNVVVVLVPCVGGSKILYRMALYREVRDASREALRRMLQKLDAK